MFTPGSRSLRRAAVLAVGAGLAVPATAPAADQLHAITDDGRLIAFQSDSPGSIRSDLALSGVAAGERLVGLDVRPATGQLYALGSLNRIYRVNATTGQVAPVGEGPFAPTLAGTGFGFDFNPVPDAIRITSEADQNLRVSPTTGQTLGQDTSLAYAPGDRLAGRNPSVTASAYTNSVAGATTTQLYGIDTEANALVVQDPPNAGTLRTVGDAAGLGVDVGEPTGFDISPAGNVGYAALRAAAGGPSNLHRIDLATGRAPAAAERPRIGLDPERTVTGLAVTGQVPDDRQPPRFSLASSSSQLRARLLVQGLRFTVACNESCTVEATLREGEREIGEATGRVEGAGQVRLAIEPNAAARARLRRGLRRYVLSVEVTDGAGNEASRTRRIRTQ